MRTSLAAVLCLSVPALAADVTIQNFSFNPSDLTVTAGTAVRWTNLDFMEHTVTSQTGPGTLIPSGVFDSGFLSHNQTFEFTFATPGTYYYYCQPHGSSMQGVVRVVAGCYANCDGSTTPPALTANDFQCFLNRFAAGQSAANCDGSTNAPILTTNDFQCFLNAFAGGCS